MNISKRTMEMLSRAHMYAASFNLNFIGTEHILLALSDASMTPVDEILSRYGVGQNVVCRKRRRSERDLHALHEQNEETSVSCRVPHKEDGQERGRAGACAACDP